MHLIISFVIKNLESRKNTCPPNRLTFCRRQTRQWGDVKVYELYRASVKSGTNRNCNFFSFLFTG